MQFDQGLDVAPLSVPAVHEFPGLLEAEADVVAASPPLPAVGGDVGGGQRDCVRPASATRLWYSLKGRLINVEVLPMDWTPMCGIVIA